MIGLTEKVLYFAKRDNIIFHNEEELRSYIIRMNLMDKLIHHAKGQVDFMIRRVFEVCHYWQKVEG